MADYAYGVRLNSEGGTTAFGASAENVRILPEVAPGLRGQPTTIANRHGQTLAGRTFYDSYDFVLELTLATDNLDTGTVVYTARSAMLKRLTNPYERVWLTRTAPYQGIVELPILVRRPIQTGNPRQRLMVPCRALAPFWRSTTVTFSAVNPVSGVTVGGDAPIGDGVFVFSGGTDQVLTHTTSGDTMTIAGSSTPAVTVDQSGDAITVKVSAAHADAKMSASEPWGIELRPGANAFTLSGGGTVTFTGRNQWL